MRDVARLAVLTPVGRLLLIADDGALAEARWDAVSRAQSDDPLLTKAAAQITAYFTGARQDFDLPLAPVSGFAAEMRAAMLAIPHGQTRSYGEIARDLGVSAQAVGQGCGANRLPLIVPCHRVLGAHGATGGYSGGGGVETKIALLRHEGGGGFLI